MKQFDHQIHNTFKEKLDNIHASEDLIAATLKSMKVEDSAHEDTEKKAGTLSAIDTRFIRNHVKAIEKKQKKIKAKRTALISVGSVAAGLALIAGSVLAVHSIQTNNRKSLPVLSPSITFTDSYQASMARNYSNAFSFEYTFYSQYTNSAVPNLLYDADGNAYKDYDVPQMEKLNGRANEYYNIPSENGSVHLEILDEDSETDLEETTAEETEIIEEI